MTCPGCGKTIPIQEWMDYPARFFTKANDGAVWHYLCVGRILREWRASLPTPRPIIPDGGIEE